MNEKVFDKEKLYKEYIILNLTRQEIAEKYNCSKTTVERSLSKFGIKKNRKLWYQTVMKSNMKKYGVSNISQLEEIKKKKELKSIEKYGVTNISKSNEVKEKKAQKSLEKYGTKSVLENEEIKAQIKKTNKIKYGTENPMQSKKVQEKAKRTNMERYGCDIASKSEIVKEKIRKTNMEKYGFDIASKSEIVKEKIKKTNMEKYGSECAFSNPIVKSKIRLSCEKKYGVPYNCMTVKCRAANGNCISKINKKFSMELEENGINNSLEFSLGNFSYDIKLSDCNKLIEINPSYTHNSTYGSEFRGHLKKPLDELYHYNKTIVANENGYQCIHIFDWDNKDKVIELIKPKEKIQARKCDIKEIDEQENSTFLNDNHLQGTCRGQEIRLGLYYNNELVEVMTLGKPRYNKKYQYELLRLCTKSQYSVIGGAEKLFKYFLKRYNPSSIISYCDNGKFSGKVYQTLGFQLLDYGKPSKHWYNSKTKQHITDNLLRQRGFDQLFKTNYGKGTSNEELMKSNGFVEIYDSGQSKYIYTKPSD